MYEFTAKAWRDNFRNEIKRAFIEYPEVDDFEIINDYVEAFLPNLQSEEQHIIDEFWNDLCNVDIQNYDVDDLSQAVITSIRLYLEDNAYDVLGGVEDEREHGY